MSKKKQTQLNIQAVSNIQPVISESAEDNMREVASMTVNETTETTVENKITYVATITILSDGIKTAQGDVYTGSNIETLLSKGYIQVM